MSRNDYYNITQLKERGWTTSMIKKLIDIKPTEFRGLYRKQPQKCYPKDYIESKEQSEEFDILKEASSRRSESMKVVADKKRQKNLESYRKSIYAVKIPKISEEELKRRTIQSKNEWYEFVAYNRSDCMDFGPVDENTLDNSTLYRWEVNFIRHELTDYDYLLEEIKGKVGTHDIYIELKNYILDKIAEKYPHLASQCNSQKVINVDKENHPCSTTS